MIDYCQERPQDAAHIQHLLDRAFGPGRFAKSAYRLREGVEFISELSLVAMEQDILRGSLRYWPIEIGASRARAILLGPLVVDPELQGQGIALRLMEMSLQKASGLGHTLVVLVGDEPYYARVGFSAAAARGLCLPGPVDRARLLARELTPGALEGVSGMIGKAQAKRCRATNLTVEKRVANR